MFACFFLRNITNLFVGEPKQERLQSVSQALQKGEAGTKLRCLNVECVNESQRESCTPVLCRPKTLMPQKQILIWALYHPAFLTSRTGRMDSETLEPEKQT